jgi:maltose/maltodextrin transport system substrate-binding protein/arabinogalactan oligomer/maltooligosaccharide transport system substrate-binding protein
MNARTRLAALAGALVIVAAACAPAPAPTPTPPPPQVTPTPEPTPEPTPTPPPAAVEGTLTIWAAGPPVAALTLFGQDFAAEYGVAVNVHELGFGDIRDQLVLRGPAGEGPDIIIGAHDWLGQLVGAGVVEPLDLGAKAEQINEVALAAFTYAGTLYGLPTGSEAIALFYNRDLVPTPPATWEEMKEIAAALQADGTVEQGYCLQKGDPYHSYPILTGMGGYIFGRDEVGAYDPQDVGLDSPGGIRYAQELDQLVKAGLLRDAVDYGACLSMMTEGRAAFWMTGPWALGDFRASGINFGVAPIPTMEQTPRPFVGVQGMMVSAFAPNMLLAQTFLTEFIATDEGMAALFEADPRLPVWLPLAATVDDPHIMAFMESAADGDPMPAIPEMAAVWEAWTTAINLIFEQAQDPEQAVRDAATRIRELIGN